MIPVQEWIDRRFSDAKKKPHAQSVRRWIDNGDVPGKKIGGRYFVDIELEQKQTGDELADRVLMAS